MKKMKSLAHRIGHTFPKTPAGPVPALHSVENLTASSPPLKWLSLVDAAHKLGVTRGTLLGLVGRGDFPRPYRLANVVHDEDDSLGEGGGEALSDDEAEATAALVRWRAPEVDEWLEAHRNRTLEANAHLEGLGETEK